ncbi:MAG: MFS transporter [Candidatus Brockarchaeota archaeon]|nr:MFS transporter [Candidatus Brockarchaeota archaeon]
MLNGKGLCALVVSTWVFGFSFGLYEIMFPLYMDNVSISLMEIGYVFTASAIFIAFLSIFLGAKSDKYGRKVFIALASLLAGLSYFFTPHFRSVGVMVLVKILFDSAVAIRNAVFATMVYEQDRRGFIASYSKVSGLEFTSQALGLASAGLLISTYGYRLPLVFSGLLQLIGFIAIVFFFPKQEVPAARRNTKNLGGKRVTKGLNRGLMIMAVSGLVVTIGGSATHSFITPMFFSKKFSLPPEKLSILMTVHRLSLGIPMLFSSRIITGLKKFSHKSSLILFTCIQGIFTSLATVPSDFTTSAALWLLHDPAGASVWLPLRSYLVQKYCNDESRGRDFNVVNFVSSLGNIIGPYLAGYTGSININLPFFVGGLVIIFSNLLLIPL